MHTYFNFAETALTVTSNGTVLIDDIYVMFYDNTSGPASSFKTEPGTTQAHNVTELSPGTNGYAPLWDVNVQDNTFFSEVKDLATTSGKKTSFSKGNYPNVSPRFPQISIIFTAASSGEMRMCLLKSFTLL